MAYPQNGGDSVQAIGNDRVSNPWDKWTQALSKPKEDNIEGAQSGACHIASNGPNSIFGNGFA